MSMKYKYFSTDYFTFNIWRRDEKRAWYFLDGNVWLYWGRKPPAIKVEITEEQAM